MALSETPGQRAEASQNLQFLNLRKIGTFSMDEEYKEQLHGLVKKCKASQRSGT